MFPKLKQAFPQSTEFYSTAGPQYFFIAHAINPLIIDSDPI